MENRNVEIIYDTDAKEIVMIHDVRFKGKRNICWNDVNAYLKGYIGESYKIKESQDTVYVGKDLANEYTGSKYSKNIKGANAKAKANAIQGIPEMLEIASNRQFEENKKLKHKKDAAFGWYRYKTRFALLVYEESGEIRRYNVFHAVMLIRHDRDGKKYLYDVVGIKKETSTPLKQ